MNSGYGRGYYGEGQLERAAPRRRSWFTVVAVLGVGAAVAWFLWPRKGPVDLGFVGKELARTPPPPLPPPPSTPAALPAASAAIGVTEATGAFLKQLEDDARTRGFVSVKDYENSVVASAKQLQAAGAKVVLAPHLQHLAPQLGT